MNFFVDASVCLLTICWSLFSSLPSRPGPAVCSPFAIAQFSLQLNYLRFGQTHRRIERDIYLLSEPANKLTICSATHSNLALQKANDRMHIGERTKTAGTNRCVRIRRALFAPLLRTLLRVIYSNLACTFFALASRSLRHRNN